MSRGQENNDVIIIFVFISCYIDSLFVDAEVGSGQYLKVGEIVVYVWHYMGWWSNGPSDVQ